MWLLELQYANPQRGEPDPGSVQLSDLELVARVALAVEDPNVVSVVCARVGGLKAVA